jgi:hypothetical protein
MPEKLSQKILWSLFIILTGLLIAFTRVGVGAHYPLDVIIGCIIGYISGLIGIFASRKYKVCSWVSNKKYYPVFMLLILACCASLTSEIISTHLIIFYLVLLSLVVPFYKITYAFTKR